MVGDDAVGFGGAVAQQVDYGGGHGLGGGDDGQVVVVDDIIGAVSDAGGAADVGMDDGHQVADVAHIGAAGAVSGVAHAVGADQGAGVGAEQFVHAVVLEHRQIAGDGLDVDGGAYGHGAGAEGAVDLAVGVHNGVQRFAADEGFHTDVGRHGTDGFAAFGDDGMDADGVGVNEGFTVEVDGGHCQGGGVEGVDAEVGRAAGVGAPAEEPDFFGQGAVVGAAYGQLPFAGGTGGVHHHRQVDVVELAQPDELGFAAQELDFALAPQVVAVFNFDVFLGRHGH